VVARALDDLVPSDEAGDLIATLPYHRAVVERRAPGTSVETICLAPAPQCERALRELPPDSLVLVLAHAPAVVPFARAVVHGLRGDELTLLSLERRDRRRWAGAARAAALVLADVLTCPEVEAAGLTNAVPLRLARLGGGRRRFHPSGEVRGSNDSAARARWTPRWRSW
jgi:hypothetical protein